MSEWNDAQLAILATAFTPCQACQNVMPDDWCHSCSANVNALDLLKVEVKRLRDAAEKALPYLARCLMAGGTTAGHELRAALDAEEPSNTTQP